MSPEPKVLWRPNSPQQEALISCPVFEVCFGGARGGGKTEGSLGDWMAHAQAYEAGAKGSFFRRKRADLTDVISRAKELFIPLGAKFTDRPAIFKFPNGAQLDFQYLERDADAANYQGWSRTRVYVEEMTQFPSPGPMAKLKAILRSAHGVPTGFRGTCNPGGPGHNWVKSRYISPNPTGYQIFTDEEELVIDGQKKRISISRVFIPSRLQNNKDLIRNDPTYILRLKQSGSEALVKAWLDGNWDIVDGAYFDEFDESLHVLPASEWLKRIPRDAMRFRAFDWGGAKPFSVGWYVVSDGHWGLPRGALLKYREWYGAKAPNVGLKMDNKSIAQGILNREKGERIRYGKADPSIFIRSGGPSIAEQMAEAGLMWQMADRNRIPGWQMVHSRLQGEMNVPMLYFLDCCEDTIRTLPALQHDETNPEDVDTEGEDHAADELRYALMSRPWQPGMIDDSPPEPIPGRWTFNHLMAESRKQREAANDW